MLPLDELWMSCDCMWHGGHYDLIWSKFDLNFDFALNELFIGKKVPHPGQKQCRPFNLSYSKTKTKVKEIATIVDDVKKSNWVLRWPSKSSDAPSMDNGPDSNMVAYMWSQIKELQEELKSQKVDNQASFQKGMEAAIETKWTAMHMSYRSLSMQSVVHMGHLGLKSKNWS